MLDLIFFHIWFHEISLQPLIHLVKRPTEAEKVKGSSQLG